MSMTTVHASETELQRIFKLQHELGRVMADMVDPMAGMSAALGLVAGSPEVAAVWAWFRSEESGDLHLIESAGLDEACQTSLDVLPSGSGLAARLLAREEVRGLPAELVPAAASVWEAAGWREAACLPVVAGGAVVGAIGAARTGEVCLNGSCLWVLRTLAGAIGTLVTQIRHETRERTVSENMNRILDSFTDPMLIVARDGRIVHGNEALRLLHPGTATPGLPVHDVLPDFASFRWVAEGDGAGPLPATARRTSRSATVCSATDTRHPGSPPTSPAR